VRPVEIGLYLPNWTGGPEAGIQPRWVELLDVAHRIEEAGFDALYVADQLVQEFADHPPLVMWECWTILSAVAAETSRIRLGPLVASAGFRNPALLAQMARTLDELSGGRATLAIGAGYDESEHRRRGLGFDRRVTRLEETVTVVAGLLRDGSVELNGLTIGTIDATLPLPGPRAAGPPLTVGTLGVGPRTAGLVARLADGWAGWGAFVARRARSPRTWPVSRTRASTRWCCMPSRSPLRRSRSWPMSSSSWTG